ncbi:glyoxalase [uncultured Streptomyces sp.]|uniref:glyoxalase n=1 Tax=uncultured Streptomyces sp. TaxID=174707 RepID=UPI0026395359|nr:glyoxalase [uncultured Streptomyces sp.]
MNFIETVTLGAADPAAAERFLADAFGLDARIGVRACAEPTDGFRGFTLALTVGRPATVDSFLGSAVEAGATVLKPASRSMWGYGGVVRAPDGTIWKVATSAKKDTGPAERRIDELVLLLGVADVAASKRFYVGQGLTVSRSFGRVYAEFEAGDGPVKPALYRRRALAKDLGVAPEGTGARHIFLGCAGGPFTDPDGFAWESAAPVRTA